MSEELMSYRGSVQYIVDQVYEGHECDQKLFQEHGAFGLENFKNFRNICVHIPQKNEYEIHYKMPVETGNAIVVKAVVLKDDFEKFLRLKVSNIRNKVLINKMGKYLNTSVIVQSWLDRILNPGKKPIFLYFRNDSYRTYHVEQRNQTGVLTFTRQMRNYSDERVYVGEYYATSEVNIFATVLPEENKELSDYEVNLYNNTDSRDIVADQGCWLVFANALINAHPELTNSRGFFVSIQEREQ